MRHHRQPHCCNAPERMLNGGKICVDLLVLVFHLHPTSTAVHVPMYRMYQKSTAVDVTVTLSYQPYVRKNVFIAFWRSAPSSNNIPT